MTRRWQVQLVLTLIEQDFDFDAHDYVLFRDAPSNGAFTAELKMPKTQWWLVGSPKTVTTSIETRSL